MKGTIILNNGINHLIYARKAYFTQETRNYNGKVLKSIFFLIGW